MASFMERLQQAQKKNPSIKVDWSAVGGATTCSELGTAREAAPTREVDASNTIDKFLPTVRGVVIDSSEGKVQGRVDLVVAITAVDVVENPDSHVLKLPSGAVVQIGVEKVVNPVKEMLAMPHVFAPVASFTEIDGILAISVPTKNAMVGGVKVENLDILNHTRTGALVEIPRVVVEQRMTKSDPPRRYILAVGGTVTVFDAPSKQPFVSERVETVFKTLGESCVGYQRQLCHALARATGTAHPTICSLLRNDYEALAAHFRHLSTTYLDHKVVIDATRTVEILSNEAAQSMEEAAAALDAMCRPPYPCIFEIHARMPFDGSRAHIVPLVQAATTPTLYHDFVEREKTCFGVTAFVIQALGKDDPDPSLPSNKLTHAGEVLFHPAARKLARTDEQKRTQSVQVLNFDASCVNLCVKNSKGEWEFCTPSLSTGQAIAPFKCAFSATKSTCSDVKNTLGYYDFYKFQMLGHELCPFMSQLFFTDKYTRVATASGFGLEASPVQPAVEDLWGGSRPGERIRNLWDVATAVKSVGVKVSQEFVKAQCVHAEDGTVITKEPYQELFEKGSDGKTPIPPVPPTLESYGYCPITSVAETNFASKIRKTPENTDHVDFYAIFEGVANLDPDVAGCKHEDANKDAALGEKALTAVLASKYAGVDLSTAIKDNVAIYAIAVGKTNESKKRANDASGDESSKYFKKTPAATSDGEVA